MGNPGLKIEEILRKFGRKQRRRTLDHVGDFTGMLGPQSVYMGTIQGKDNHIVYGEVHGECEIEGTLVLGEGGRWKGKIRASTKLELAHTAFVRGKITSPVVAIARGATHDGSIRMTKQTQITRYHERRESPEKDRDETEK